MDCGGAECCGLRNFGTIVITKGIIGVTVFYGRYKVLLNDFGPCPIEIYTVPLSIAGRRATCCIDIDKQINTRYERKIGYA